jgi:peptidoglycan/LPS O-acetylase OafA/YrhL
MPSGATYTRTLNREIPNATSKRNLRPDIQGLRMLAVVAVILDHLVAWPTGGFVGVDVFFVISGFLITGILIREHEKNDHISFVNFYRRRLKRIVPAATLTLIVTVVAARFFFNSTRYTQTLWDGIYAFFFSANWHFAAAGTDYFQAAGPVSPLQHFWSLSVEEQFYFVWPWLMLGVLALAGLRRGFTQKRTLTGIVMAVIVIATFTWAMLETTTSPTVAYFSTFTRAWELGFGALLAIASPWWSKIPATMRPVLGWAGFLGILASYFIINDSLPFPAPWALLPVIATGLVIVGGTGGEQRFLWPLTNPVSFYIGNISYSLYLWHFPVIVFAGVLIGSNPWVYFPVTVILMLAFAVVSYYLIEEPIQRSPWLERHRRTERRSQWVKWRASYGNRMKYGWFGVLVAATASLLVMGYIGTSAPYVSETAATAFAAPTTTPTDGSDAPVVATALSAEQAAIEEALNAQEFPQLVPAVSDLGFTVWADQMLAENCVNVTEENLDSCAYGAESGNTAVIFGDSVAMAWVPGVRAALEAAGWRVQQLTFAECPSINVEVTHAEDQPFPECGPWREWALQKIAEIHPQLTIVSSSDSTAQRLASNAVNLTAADEIKTGTTSVLEAVVPASDRVVVLGAPPRGFNLTTCAVPGATPKDCVTPPAELWLSFNAAQKAAAEGASVEYIDTRSWFCGATNNCPAFAANTPIRTDAVHLTIEYSRLLGPVLGEALIPGAPAEALTP